MEKKRSEEVKDIIDKMPVTFGKWVAIAVLVFTSLLFFFSWIIKYPDVVSGQIKINSNQMPVRLIANVAGKIYIFQYNAQDSVKAGDYIAIIQNPTCVEDVRKVSDLICQFDPNKGLHVNSKVFFPEKLSLGELNLKYYTFISALENQYHYEEYNPYRQQEKGLLDNIEWYKNIQRQIQESLATMGDKLKIAKKWLDKDAYLNQKQIIHEQEFDQVSNEYLNTKQAMQSLEKEAISMQMQISDIQNKLKQLKIEQQETEKRIRLELLSSYHDLLDNIKLWEQKYVFKSPIDGQVEFLKFWANDQFVQLGEEVFSIIPKQTTIIGQVLLPSIGAGKVLIGCRVSIKLENYPYMEFGSVEGIVSSISLISKQQQLQQGNMEMYLVTVDLPQGLTTNYGEKLDFKYEIGGIADIIVKDRRLIQRLFDNLKYGLKAK